MDENVDISVEITGEYTEVVSKLAGPATNHEHFTLVLSDLSAILGVVIKLDGGTRSAIADNLPGNVHHSYDAEGVVDVLQVLAQYNLVVLEGTTWYPGPALHQ